MIRLAVSICTVGIGIRVRKARPVSWHCRTEGNGDSDQFESHLSALTYRWSGSANTPDTGRQRVESLQRFELLSELLLHILMVPVETASPIQARALAIFVY